MFGMDEFRHVRLLCISICGFLIASIVFYIFSSLLDGNRENKLFAGCEPPPHIRNRRWFGFDRLKEISKAHSEGWLNELFLLHFVQTGPTLTHRFLGKAAVGTIEPANLEAILSTKMQDWGLGPRSRIAYPLFGDGISTQEGRQWVQSRRAIARRLQPRYYADLTVINLAINDLLLILGEGGTFDLQKLFFSLTLDISSRFFLGKSVHSLRDGGTKGQDFARALDLAQECMVRKLRFIPFDRLLGLFDFHPAHEKVHALVDEVINDNISLIPEEDSMLKCLLEPTANRNALRGQVINLLVAGRDTTACLLSWTFYLLAKHQHVLARLREEIEMTPQPNMTGDTLKGMPYLQNVLKENTVLPTGGGVHGNQPVFVSKGTAVAWSTYALHRRPEFFGADAEVFDPDRWKEIAPPPWAYLPFSDGPRRCLGKDLALTEAALVVVRILKRFRTVNLAGKSTSDVVGKEKQRVTLVLSKADGCIIDLGR